MQAPTIPADETRRLLALHSMKLLDSLPEERFDRITRLARRLFDVDLAGISLVDDDRQWFKSKAGLDAGETPRELSFCAHAILDGDVMVVTDATADERFHDNPLVTGETGLRFYAGCPIAGPSGHRLGTVCVVAREPRELDADEIRHLRDLARMVEEEIAMQDLAISDPLTQLCNRRGFEMIASNTLALCRRLGYPATLAYLDVDDLRNVNEHRGHDAGDRLLADFGMILAECFRQSDVVARIEDDAFAVLLSGTSASNVETPLKRLVASTREREERFPKLPPLRYSVGVASFDPRRHRGVDELLRDGLDRMREMQDARGDAA